MENLQNDVIPKMSTAEEIATAQIWNGAKAAPFQKKKPISKLLVSYHFGNLPD